MSSAPQESAGPEYYIRNATDTEARGPFKVDQLVSLAEGGQVTPETFYYDAATEQWLAIGANPELKSAIWPEKKKLGFKQKELKSLNPEPVSGEKTKEITVQDFLDAAEGRTDETKGKKDKTGSMAKAAMLGTRGAAIICMISAVAMTLPSIDALTAMDLAKLMDKPFVFLGVVDAVIGLLLFLGVISIYPLVRFRAVFGLGFLGFLFMTQGQSVAVMAVAAGSAGLYFCTIFLSFIPLGIALAAGIGGMVALAGLALG
jgi:hypothetical protein